MYQLTLQITDAELEHSLQQIAQKEGKSTPEIALVAIQQFIQQYRATTNDPWVNPDLDLPSIDTTNDPWANPDLDLPSIDTTNDPWANPDLDLPSIDTGITDFARNHDHYLYGNGTMK